MPHDPSPAELFARLHKAIENLNPNQLAQVALALTQAERTKHLHFNTVELTSVIIDIAYHKHTHPETKS